MNGTPKQLYSVLPLCRSTRSFWHCLTVSKQKQFLYLPRSANGHPIDQEASSLEATEIIAVKADFLQRAMKFCMHSQGSEASSISMQLMSLVSGAKEDKQVPVTGLWLIANLLGIRIRCSISQQLANQMNAQRSDEDQKVYPDCIYGVCGNPLSLRVRYSIQVDDNAKRVEQYDLFFPDDAGSVLLANEKTAEVFEGHDLSSYLPPEMSLVAQPPVGRSSGCGNAPGGGAVYIGLSFMKPHVSFVF